MANLKNNTDNENQSLPKKEDSAIHETSNLAKDTLQNSKKEKNKNTEVTAKKVSGKKWWAKFLVFLLWTFLLLFAVFFIAINLKVTKNWAAKQTLEILNKDFKTKITTESVEINYFGDVTIQGLKIEDHHGKVFIKAKEFIGNSDWIILAKNAIFKKSNAFIFKSLAIKDADIEVITYKGDSISNFIRFVNKFDSGKKSDPKKPVFELSSRIEILDSKVSIKNENSEGDAGNWLSAKNVNLKISKLKVHGSDVKAKINNLSFETKRYGKTHILDTFSGNLELTKEHLSLEEITINTDKSLLMGDMKLSLNNGSWADFTNKVFWDMKLDFGSQISGYDISYFMTNWDNPQAIKISGEMKGPLNNFKLSNFFIGNPKVNISTKLSEFKNLLNGNFSIETNSLSTDFTYIDLKKMLPSFIAIKMKNFADEFGRIKYNGSARVNPDEIYAKQANLLTGIGQASVIDFYLTDYSTDLPKYRGLINTKDFNTTIITKSPEVGLISGQFQIDGESFDVNTMKLTTKSQISKIEILNKEINNLFLDGTLDKRIYHGIIKINDEQAKAKIDGIIDFKTKVIKADILADIDLLNINYFADKSSKQIVSGKLDGTISMSNINDLELDAVLDDIHFNNGDSNYFIKNTKLKTYFENKDRIIEIDAPGALSGKIGGQFNLSDLNGMIENGIGKILVGPEPRKIYRGQHFNLDIDVAQGLVAYFSNDIKIPQGVTLNGSYEGDSNHLVLNLDLPELKYIIINKKEITALDLELAKINPAYSVNEKELFTRDSLMVSNANIRINTAQLNEQIISKVARLEYQKNIINDFTITARNEDNSLLRISTNFLYGSPEDEKNGELKSYTLNFNQSTNKFGDYIVRFDPTSIEFNNTKWTIDTELDQSITYRKRTKDFLLKNIKIYSDQSEVEIKDGIFISSKDFETKGSVRNLELDKLFNMFQGGNTMELHGLANGNFDIKNNKNELRPLLDLDIKNIFLKNDAIGDLVIKAQSGNISNVYNIEAKLISSGIIGKNNLLLNGTIDNNFSSPRLNLNADLNDLDLSFANQFVQGIFSNLRGKANGILNIEGTFNDINYNGDIALEDFGLKLDFTGVDYSFEDTVINLSRGLAILNDIGIKDGRSKSAGTISGAIQFETLSSMGVSLILRANNLMMLNTTQDDYDLFWGKVYGKGDLFVDGPVKALNLSTPKINILENSVFTFNSNSTSSVDKFKMLRFLKQDDTGIVSLEKRKKSGPNMNIDFNVEVDKKTEVNVLVGDDVGDISVRGFSNNLGFKMSRSGTVNMDGSYFVDNGTFISKKFLSKTFQIEKGSNIRWDGNPLSPSLDINADYTRTISNAGEYLNVGNLQPIQVKLQTSITQTLNNPLVEFDISAINVSSQVNEAITIKMAQKDERVLQFGSILLLNRFNVSNDGFDISVGNLAQDSGYNLFFKQLGSVLNTISERVQIDLNYVSGDINSNTGDRANAGINVALSPRVTLKTGLGIPLNSGNANTTNDFLSGEGTVEMDVSKKNDGTLLLRAYSKPMNIGMTAGGAGSNGTANQTYGGGVVWTKSFNQIFKKKAKKKDSLQTLVHSDSINN